MSLTLPTSKRGICYFRAESIRSVGCGFASAEMNVSCGKIRTARLHLGLARMSLESLAQATPKTTAKSSLALRKKVIHVSEVVAKRGVSKKSKISAIKGLFEDFHKLEGSISSSCDASS